MKAKVLIADDNDYIRGKLKESLQAHYELIEASSAQEALEQARTALPALIFMDIHMPPGQDGLEAALLLKNDPLTREIPIIHLTLSEDESLREESLRTKADGFIRKPFFEEEILTKAQALIARRGRFTTSYTARFIRSMIRFSDSRFAAARMVNMGRQICRALEVDEGAEKDILQAARLLSCAIADGNTARVVALYEEMGFARPVAAVLNAAPGDNLHAAIAWALFCHESRVQKNMPQRALAFGKWQGVYDQVAELYANPAASVESPQDLDYAQGEFTRMIADMPAETQNRLWRLMSRILTHELAYHGGALFFREGGTVVIRPRDGVLRHIGFERVSYDEPLASSLRSEIRLGHPVIVMDLHPPKTPAAPKPAAPRRAALNARAFLADSPLGKEELEDLRLLEKDMQEFLEEISYTHHPHEALLHLNALLARYASTLMIVNEFSAVATNLMAFTLELAQLPHLDDATLRKLSVLIGALVADLTEWREAIFVRKDAADIHFLDSSLLADCEQALAALHAEDNSEEIELF